jgi:splicing factor U2AF subunit
MPGVAVNAALQAALAAAAGAAAAVMPAGQNLQGLSRRARRIHVGNLPLGVGLSAPMLKQFFNAALVSASLHDPSFPTPEPVADAMLGSEGKFGFLEFRTIAECTSCLVLNNIELGGKQIRVERPRDYAPMPEVMLEDLRNNRLLGNTPVAPDGQDLISAAVPGAVGAAPGPPPPGAAPSALALPAVDASKASCVVAFINMMTAAACSDAAEMAEILDDTRSECARIASTHGRVLHLASPKPGAAGDPAAGLDADAISLKVFVRFDTADAALACALELHGKAFDGRTVTAAFWSESAFEQLLGLPCHTLQG